MLVQCFDALFWSSRIHIPEARVPKVSKVRHSDRRVHRTGISDGAIFAIDLIRRNAIECRAESLPNPVT